MEHSRAHNLLLSKFLKPQIIASKKFIGGQPWEDWGLVLGEPVNVALRHLAKDGLLRTGTHLEKLICKYKLSEIKEMLRQRRLRVSGRKVDVAERLLRADPAGVNKAIKGLNVAMCTDYGRKVAEHYLYREKENRTAAEQGVWDFLRKRDFEAASRSVASYEATQLIPRGMNVDWENYDHSRNLELLNYIFQSNPLAMKRLQLTEAQLDNYRVVAGMFLLFGKWKGSQEFYNRNPAMHKAVHLLKSHAHYLMEKTGLKQRGTKLVQVIGYGSQPAHCNACQKLGEKRFRLDSVPELPHEGCEDDWGCRCDIVVGNVESWEVIKALKPVVREPTAIERSAIESAMTKKDVFPETKALCWAYFKEVLPTMIKALDGEFGRPSWIRLFSTRSGMIISQQDRRGVISYLYYLIEVAIEIDRQAEGKAF